MSADLSQLIPEFEPYARDLVTQAGAAGLQPRVTSTLRSYADQKRLYSRYLAGQSQLPAAPPGRSAHEFGYAFDMVVSPYDALADVGSAWIEAGGVWHASDPVHFEYPGFTAPPQEGDLGTIADWMAQLPWYASIFLPFKLIMGEKKIDFTSLQRVVFDYTGIKI